MTIRDFENQNNPKDAGRDYHDGADINDDGNQPGMGSITVQSSINDSKQLKKRPELYPNNPYYEEFEEEFKISQNIEKHKQKEQKQKNKNYREKDLNQTINRDK